MLKSLFQSVGWAWAIRILALVALVLCTASNFLIRSRLPPARNASSHPDARIFRNRAFTLTTAGIFLLEFALFIPLTYITSYMLHKGFSEDFAFQILPVLNGASVLGRALPGWWADKFGPFNGNLLAVLLSAIACLAVWLPAGSTTGGIVVFSLLFGFASGNNISISPVCIGRLCKTQNYGRYYATTYTVVSLACLIGIPIAGEIISACKGDYWGLILFTGLIYCLGLVFLFAAKVSCVGWDIRTIF
jgi:predicted MFS family arabinose efflux permease